MMIWRGLSPKLIAAVLGRRRALAGNPAGADSSAGKGQATARGVPPARGAATPTGFAEKPRDDRPL